MAGNIPQHFIDELLSNIDIVELIDGFVPLKKTGSSYSCCCPFHQEKTPSFHVIPNKQFFYCFGCGISGNSIKFVMQFSHLDFPEAIAYLADTLGMALPEKSTIQEQASQQSFHDVLEKIKQLYQKALYTKPDALIQYIKKRGLNKAVIEQFQLGYSPDNWQFLCKQFPNQIKILEDTGMIIPKENHQYYDRFRHRLMFPLHNRKGKLIGFAGRVIDNEHKPKYMNSPETILFHKQKELYGLHQVLQTNEHPKFIIVVEGYLDVISLFQFGIPNAVATMGTATSHYHLHLFNIYSNDIIFCFDGDEAGLHAAWRALENCLPIYNQLSSIRFLFLPEGHDPDSFIRENGQEAFIESIERAQPLHRYYAQELHTKFGKNGPQKLVQEAQKALNDLEEGPGKELLINELSRMTRIDPYRLTQLFQQPNSPLPQTQSTTTDQTRSPLRIALALLIQNPEIYIDIASTIIDTSNYPEPLQLALEQLKINPQLSSAALIERFRDTAFYDGFNKLAIFAHHIPLDKQGPSLTEIFKFLDKQHLNNQIEHLIKKSRSNGLEMDEKEKLQKLLQKRLLASN
jgi:DNA primase